MKKLSYPKIIFKILEDKEWHPNWHFICRETPYGWIGSSGDRRCRELANEERIERKVENRKVYYKENEKPQMKFEEPKINSNLQSLFV